MVKIKIIGIGKDKDTWVTNGQAHYSKLLSRYAKISFQFIPTLKKTTSLSIPEIKLQEAVLLEKKILGNRYIVLTDTGKKFSSVTFAKQLEQLITKSSGQLTFVIGGAYGLHDSVIKKAELSLSLSPMTFSHQLVRLVITEQLYRAFSILHNTDYHK